MQERLGSWSLAALPSAGILADGRRQLRTLFEAPEPSSVDDLAAIDVLADVLQRLDTDMWAGFDELAQVKVAFYGSVNPIHFAPPAFALGETCAVACWLGSLSRFVPAPMPAFVGAYWNGILGEDDIWPVSDWAPDAFLIERAACFMSPKDLREWIKSARTSATIAKREKNCLVIIGSNKVGSARGHIVSSPSYC